MFSTQECSARLVLLISDRTKVVSLFYIVIETAEKPRNKKAHVLVYLCMEVLCNCVC